VALVTKYPRAKKQYSSKAPRRFVRAVTKTRTQANLRRLGRLLAPIATIRSAGCPQPSIMIHGRIFRFRGAMPKLLVTCVTNRPFWLREIPSSSTRKSLPSARIATGQTFVHSSSGFRTASLSKSQPTSQALARFATRVGPIGLRLSVWPLSGPEYSCLELWRGSPYFPDCWYCALRPMRTDRGKWQFGGSYEQAHSSTMLAPASCLAAGYLSSTPRSA